MKTATQLLGALLPIAVLAAVIAGCEDTMDPVAPSDGKIGITAKYNPIILNPNQAFPAIDDTGQLVGTTPLTALVTDKNGRPVQNVAVLFSTSAGVLATTIPDAVFTDPNGFAPNVLTVRESDPVDKSGNLTVAAQSGVATGSLAIAKVVVPCTPPVVLAGSDVALSGDTCVLCSDGLRCEVTLTGAVAESTSGAQVTFQWECGNGDPLPDPGETATCCYDPPGGTAAATYDAKLTVTINRFPDPQRGCTASGEDEVGVTVR